MSYGYHHHTMLWLSAVVIVFAGSMLVGNAGYSVGAPGPVIQNVRATDITLTDAAIRWDTSVPSDSQISYGPTSAEGYLTTVNSFFTTSHAVTLTGLQYSATYHYSVISKDMSGNMSQSADQQFTTPVNTPTTFPFLAYSWLPVYNSTGTMQGNWHTAYDGLHQDNLLSNQYYPLVAQTMDDSADNDIQATVSFRTGAEFGVCARMNIWAQGYCFGTSAAGNTRILIFPQTTSTPSVLATGTSFPIAQNTDYKIKFRLKGPSLFGKIYLATAPEPPEWNVVATDPAATYPKGKAGFYTYLTQPSVKAFVVGPITSDPVDTTPPVLSGVSATSIGLTSASIGWISDEYSDTQVEYGPTASYGTLTTLDSTLVLQHTASIAGLAGNTAYHYRVRSKDPAGNLGVSTDATFTTLGVVLPPSTSTSPAVPPVVASPSSPAVPQTPPQAPIVAPTLPVISRGSPQPGPGFPVAETVSPHDLRKDALALRRIKSKLPAYLRYLGTLFAFIDLQKRAGISIDPAVSDTLVRARNLTGNVQKGKTYDRVRSDLIALQSAAQKVSDSLPTVRQTDRWNAVKSPKLRRALQARSRFIVPFNFNSIAKDIH